MNHKIYDLCLKCKKSCKKRQYKTEILACCRDFERVIKKRKGGLKGETQKKGCKT